MQGGWRNRTQRAIAHFHKRLKPLPSQMADRPSAAHGVAEIRAVLCPKLRENFETNDLALFSVFVATGVILLLADEGDLSRKLGPNVQAWQEICPPQLVALEDFRKDRCPVHWSPPHRVAPIRLPAAEPDPDAVYDPNGKEGCACNQ
jgi:hypothetical protein